MEYVLLADGRELAYEIVELLPDGWLLSEGPGDDRRGMFAPGYWIGHSDSEPLVAMAGERKTGRVQSARNVTSTSIFWAWEGRAPLRHIVPISGREGVGKSILECWMTARWSNGELAGNLEGEPVMSMIIASEDGIEDTWKPRLDLMDADLDQVKFWLPYDGWNLTDLGDLARRMRRASARILIFESLFEHLPPSRGAENANSAQFVRQSLRAMRQLMRDLDGTCVFTMHPPKAKGNDARSMFQASQAFTAVPRTTLFVEWHPDDLEAPEHERRRVLVRGKGNVGKDPDPLEFWTDATNYRADDDTESEREYIKDVRRSAVTMYQLLQPRRSEQVTKVGSAVATIEAALVGQGWQPASPILRQLEEAGLGSKSTITAAKIRAQVKTKKVGRPAAVHWMIGNDDGSSNVIRLSRSR